jgi:GTP-binding protein
MHFLDQAKIFIKSGAGGPGAVSASGARNMSNMAARTAATAARAATSCSKRSPGLNTLIDFRYKQHFKAQRGTPGAGRTAPARAARTLSSRCQWARRSSRR